MAKKRKATSARPWPKFFGMMKKKHPGMSMKEIAAEYKLQQNPHCANPRRNPRYGDDGDITFSRKEQGMLLGAHTADILLWGLGGFLLAKYLGKK